MDFDFVWSHSGFEQFKTCPYQFYRQRIVRDLPKEDTPALQLGRRVHTMFEERIAIGAPFAPEFATYERYAQAVLNWTGVTRVEVKLGITQAWSPASFFGEDVRGRGAIDVLNIDGRLARVVDWKTSAKVRADKCRAQFQDNAVLIFANYPEVDVITGLWAHVVIGESYTQGLTARREHDFAAQRQRVEQQLDQIADCEALGVWPCRPSGLCRGWCPVQDCKHWRPKR